MTRPINIGLSPNLEMDDVQLAMRILLNGPDKDVKQKMIMWFKSYFPGFEVVLFNSGRSAEWGIIKALGLSGADEVLVQDFTCVAVDNSVHWAGAKTIDVKIESGTYNMDPDDLKKKITKNSKAVIVQHTFGQVAKLTEIQKICDDHKLILIEDCAHSLGATYKNKKLGTFGDMAFFSLGRDKVISSVFGGVVITKNKILAQKLNEIEMALPENSWWWVTQQLLHPILTWPILPISDTNVGKLLFGIIQKLFLSKAVYDREKVGEKPSCFPAKYSPKLIELGIHQLEKLERFNAHRRKIAQIYFDRLKSTDLELPPNSDGDIYLRFSVTHFKAHELYKKAKAEFGWILGNWYAGPYPVLNLPTYPNLTIDQVNLICEKLKIWLR